MSWFKRATPQTAADAAASPSADPVVVVPAIANWRVLAALVLCAANAAVSGLLLLEHHGHAGAVSKVEELCGAGAESGCATVARSRWSQVAGVPVAAIGLAFYSAMALLLLLGLLSGPQARAAAGALTLLALVVAVVVDVVLLGVQAVAIRAFCKLCLLTYVVNALAVVALLPARRDGSVIGEAVTRRDGRLALAAWTVAALAVIFGVALGEYGLSQGEAASPGAVLGVSPARPPVEPGSEADRYREEARAASEEARRLQEILNDPDKLERYFSDKASREFEQAPVYALDLAGVPVKGPPQAPVKVVEYSDFLCPFCRQVAGGFDAYLPVSGGRVAVYYKNYPLDPGCNPNVKGTGHAGSCGLALAGLCAQEQGKFWPYHDRVFAAQAGLHNPQMGDVLRLAGEAGLDTTALSKCMESGDTRQRLQAQVAEAQQGGVNATPTLFINGRRLPRLQDFEATVNKEAARLGLGNAPPPALQR